MKVLAVWNFTKFDPDRPAIVAEAKREAEPYLAKGDVTNGWLTFVDVMRSHHITQDDVMLSVGTMMLINGKDDEIKEFINGFE